jgi:predicted PurR-regulated permease PerM
MAVASVIPAFGTAIVWGPALVILLLIGDFAGVFILAIGCGLIAGNLDNLVRPRLVGKDTEMHDLYVLFGTLGGIAMFGILGIIIGPIIAALFMTVWEIYGDSFKDYLPKVGSALKNLVDEPTIDADQTAAQSSDESSDEKSG